MVLVEKLKICHVFLFGKIGQGNVFDHILERKQAFLDCNKRSLKRRKIGIFFFFLSFRHNRPGKCVLLYSKEKKCFSIKRESFSQR